MPIVAGLGNAGQTYHGTRHNVGFEVVGELADRWHARWTEGEATRTAYASFAGQPIILLQPQWFMNRSGEALAQVGLLHDVGELIVVHDELDLPSGRVRIKVGGGTAGHRGVASIAAHFGPDFTRIRVGIGRSMSGAGVVEHVLERFSPEEEPVAAAAVQSAADAVECVLERGLQAAMQRFNTRRTETENAAPTSA
jgi:PTH1 family peptidyl-tRNA hydrolase